MPRKQSKSNLSKTGGKRRTAKKSNKAAATKKKAALFTAHALERQRLKSSRDDTNSHRR